MFHFRFIFFVAIFLILAAALLYGLIRNLLRICMGKAKKRHWMVFLLCACVTGIIVWGMTKGFERFEVRHVEFVSESVPKNFDGYRIVVFADAHVGTFTGNRQSLLREAITAINAQKPDAIMFCGDIVNRSPEELTPFIKELCSLKAKDGVYSVLGNHDYSLYQHNATEQQKSAALERTKSLERSFGWHLLLDENVKIGRDGDTIYVAGEENQGSGPFPKYANVEKTMKDIPDSAFVIMLQHDPSAWREHILEKTNAQITLSGHTHAGQFVLFGWSLSSLMYKEVKGAYYEDDRMLYVTSGLGGVIPFRFGVSREIVVITLKRK